VALYQLPFVTLNEASPETFDRLAAAYPNLIFFKDSSGRDLIAASPQDKGEVFLVRGGEGDYTRWLKISGGSYDGFLLSVTNVFAPELSAIVASLETGDLPAAKDLSDRVTKALFDTIAVVRSLPCGNAFTNANKAMDHFFAFGPGAVDREGPMLKGGMTIPREMLEATKEVLQSCRLLPTRGYLE
jgi:dihydrodipicolinate synthase/N-acetylneuraminate lyase